VLNGRKMKESNHPHCFSTATVCNRGEANLDVCPCLNKVPQIIVKSILQPCTVEVFAHVVSVVAVGCEILRI
jgi:hypothetical protein